MINNIPMIMPQQNQAQARTQENKKQYSEVYAHEQAHKSAAGSFGGSIVVEQNSDGTVTGGHVNIQMPTLDKNNPEKTKTHAQTVINAAMAPGDPSGQDYKVAAEARQTLTLAEKAITDKNTGNNLDIQA